MSSMLRSRPRDFASRHHRRRHVERLHEVLEVGALAADVEAQALDDEPDSRAACMRSTASPGSQPNFDESSTIDPVFGTRSRTHQAGVRRVLGDLLHLRQVVEGDERLVFVQRLQRLLRLHGVGVDDFVPDEILPLLGRAAPDQSRRRA